MNKIDKELYSKAQSVEQLKEKCLAICLEELELPEVDENGVVIEETAELDIYGGKATMYLMGNKEIERANASMRRAALYMDMPHPSGRDPKGENDFASIRMVAALNSCYDKFDEETRKYVKRFLLEKDIESKYGSENHFLMFHVSRYMAAEFYSDGYFSFYKMSAKEVLEEDKKWLIEYLTWRAKYGFGEFDSAGYLGEDIMMVSILDCYAKDKEIKQLGHMMVNLIALEMLSNIDANGYAVGARGRSYPSPYTCTIKDKFRKIYVDMLPDSHINFVLAPAFPDKWVIDSYTERKFPCEVYERKNLHSTIAWFGKTPDWEKIDVINKTGSISKYTYMCDEYSIGAINNQDDYPASYYEGGYAHHQQVEWALWLTHEDELEATKLFSSHPGRTGEHNIWTGDLGCCCNNSYATKDTCITIYDIKKETELDYTHMFYEPQKYDGIKYEDNAVFLKKGSTYVYVYVAKPYTVGSDNKVFRDELKSVARKNAWAVRVGLAKDYGTFEEFICAMKKISIKFDEENMVFTFDNLTVSRPKGNAFDGKQNVYPYKNVYDAPWIKSEWDNTLVEVVAGGKTYVMDFDKLEIYTK